jgi:hypothetical protein
MSSRRTRSPFAAALFLLVLAAAPLALAQKPAKPKKGTKPPPSATAEPEPAPPPPPPPAPEPEPTEESPKPKKAEAAEETEPSIDITNVKEDPSRRYYFVGLRYRGDVIPKFLINAGADEGATIYSNSLGAELDMRKDGMSQVLALTYADYNTGDILFHEKGKPDTSNNYSVVNSSLKAIYASIDLLWSAPISEHLDFEYGFGAGLGIVFGNLGNAWVYQSANGPLVGSNGNHYTPCSGPTDGAADPNTGCKPQNHTNPSPAKFAGYNEDSGLFGPKPILFPMLNIPQIGLRYKPIKQLETRLGLGFSITGFWFGLSADYGLEQPEKGVKASEPPPPPEREESPNNKSSRGPAPPRDTL